MSPEIVEEGNSQSVAVFSGSTLGANPIYASVANELGKILAARGLSLICGGGNSGLMGVLANSVLNAGGMVIGVIPRELAGREVANERLSSIVTVNTIDDRNAFIQRMASTFISMPGGLGTVEEFFRIFSLVKMGLLSKPLGILNIAGYYDPILMLLSNMASDGFIKGKHIELCSVADDATLLLDMLFKK
ncbi:TIGR00730 family Rossman fold protein [Burkholderia gladioli]|uniref:LOG family protein n=1 Tax=Burkholderia gladioli TaxID=28095 RepID=UPI00163F4494|nr:TIGR00730 family Rossman fold protein [Burkholderia gladioli]